MSLNNEAWKHRGVDAISTSSELMNWRREKPDGVADLDDAIYRQLFWRQRFIILYQHAILCSSAYQIFHGENKACCASHASIFHRALSYSGFKQVNMLFSSHQA